MARAINRLTARTVAAMSSPGRHADGGGLYLQVTPAGAKSWVFLFTADGKRKEVGLGGLRDVSLAEARQKAAQTRALIGEGKDPLEERRAAEAAQEAEKARPLFGEFADALVEDIRHGFRNEKHRAQWASTLSDTYCKSLRRRKIDDVTTDDVLRVLQPIWQAKNETASRIRGRIERVLDAARAKGLRTGENPARWRGHLDTLLPKRQKLQRGHHAAMPYADLPAFVARLRASEGISARALELIILTASRSGEVREMVWNEIDLEQGLWCVPAARMKAGKEHRVPLCDRAVQILTEVAAARRTSAADAFVFPGQRGGRPLSVMAYDMLLRRMKVEDVTVHGFRSSFRDWVSEETDFPREVAEAALAHTVGDATERAYRRGDALEKRRALMEAWAAFIEAGVKEAAEAT